MFKEEYKKAYDEIKVADGKVNEILKQAKFKNLPKQRNTMWKNVVATMLLAIMLIVGINIPAFAQEIERVSRILNTSAIDYTYYKSLQRENLEWTQNAFVPNNATVKKDGIIMKVELVTFYRKKIEAIIPDFIKYAISLGFKCAVTTNGTLVTERTDELISSGVYKVNLSVHSFEGGEEEKYLNYIESLADFADKASNSGVLTVLRLWNKGFDGGLNDRTLEILKERLKGEWKWGSRGARIRHKLHLEYGDRFDWPDMEAENMGDCLFCYGLRDHFGILCDGSVIPCCLDREGNIALGNIHETPIRDILSSDRAEVILRGFDNRIAVEELCQKCGYARRFG